MSRYALLLAYDGGGFAGWARQIGLRTAAAECDAAFLRLGEPDARIEAASRLDAGVHACGQVAHVDCARAWPTGELARALDHQLAADIACLGAARVADDWDASLAAQGKAYRYRLDIGAQRDPLRHRSHWRPSLPLDRFLLESAAAEIESTTDFTAFARAGDHRTEFTTRLQRIRWQIDDDEAVVTVVGDRFAYRLVRGLVGAMVGVAAGTWPIDDLRRACRGQTGDVSRQVAPPQGLYLEAVDYDPQPEWIET
jgi:tRNA pseudouridine38-40 synthase